MTEYSVHTKRMKAGWEEQQQRQKRNGHFGEICPFTITLHMP